ncbi:unnamed protein product [Rangifer tarandus platyrhynchus]|uniref:Uncharacterized protein n=1 Tax=Rangifer tarandus platyrhynchus TaxID=3082113 RepID=A0AC59ZS12_RANTA
MGVAKTTLLISVLLQLRSAWAHLPPAGSATPAVEKGDLLMPLGHEPPSSCLTRQKRSPGPDRGLQKRPRLRLHPGHSSATAQEQPVDSSESSSALRSTSWMQPPAREEHLASGLCWEVPVSLRHCSRTGRSSRAGHAAGPLSPQARSLPASRPARDKGACGGLAARRAGPRFPRRQLLAGLAKAAVLVRAPFTEGGARPGQDASSVYLQGRPCPAPSGRSGQAGGRGVSGGQWAGARARPPDSGPLLREPRADGLMGQKRSVKGDRSGL